MTPDTHYLSGTSTKLYGHSSKGVSLALMLDGKNTSAMLNATNSANDSSLIFRADDMEDVDHQLYGEVASLELNGILAVDYFFMRDQITIIYIRSNLLNLAIFSTENSSGNPVDPFSAGENATNVPKEAAIVDDTSSDITFHNASQWFHGNFVAYHNWCITELFLQWGCNMVQLRI